MSVTDAPQIVVIGLGYVGLPLAVALARSFETTGYDINIGRMEELRSGHDRTGEVDPEALRASRLKLCSTLGKCSGADVYIITVPTPVDRDNQPDLTPLILATEAVAQVIVPEKKPIIVYESTVYPGVTEDICSPVIESISGLRRGQHFLLGYSPERVNPGDPIHKVDTIMKVVAGETPEVTERLAKIYGKVTSGGIFKAKSIKVAEAAKVIENAQRDINIAFMNEITQIFSKMHISIWDVLEAAGTKWNFLKFQPGLVGGHCIGVDPYYLSYRAQRLGHQPDVILAGRAINDGMGVWIADQLHAQRGRVGSVLVMGLAFKENVPDLRNSRVIDVIERLRLYGHVVSVCDPLVDPVEARHEYGVALDSDALESSYDLVVVAVPHASFEELSDDRVSALVAPGGLLADIKSLYGNRKLSSAIQRWSL